MSKTPTIALLSFNAKSELRSDTAMDDMVSEFLLLHLDSCLKSS